MSPGEYSVGWNDVKENLVIEAATDSAGRYHEKRSLELLDGVMGAIKDEYDVAGYPTTLGSANENTRAISDHDSWCVHKFKEAGAVILGKATMVEYGMDEVSHCILSLFIHSRRVGRHVWKQHYIRHSAESLQPAILL
jgi:Asp-tRNA(Asn)/Glu-tRNA(Gln) amidotransferase A subunit family amidase